MMRQNLLDENIFTITLPRSENERGEIIFGALPDNVTRADLTEVPLDTLIRGNAMLTIFWTSIFRSDGKFRSKVFPC